MYNYYIELKKKEKLEEEEKEKERKKKMKIIREKKMKQYTRNYENRIKKFIYDMADKPVILRESIKPFTTTREELLFEESNKILFHKGFVFNLYQTDRERLNTYINEREKEKDYENKIISYNASKDNNNENLTTKITQITQPQMRFKPRTDLERIYQILSNYRPSKVNKKSKKIIENHLNDLKKKFMKMTNKSENMIFNDDTQKSIEQLIQDIGIEKDKKKGVFEEISKKLKIQKNKRVDNSNAKALHSDLYNKTYFNAVENYTIFKDTCFLPKKKIKKTYHDRSNTETSDNFNINFNEDVNYNKTQKLFKQKKTIIKKRNINNDNLESGSYSKNMINISSPNELVNLLSNSKENVKEENLMKSLDNVDLFIQGLKVNKPKLTKKEQNNIDVVKSLAFNNIKKKKNLPILKIDNKSYQNSNIDDKENYSSSNEGYEDYAMRKQEEKIKVNGIEYKKNDLENLSKAIMESCNYSKKKYRKSDSVYSHSGNGKLMFTNGLTLKEFEKKYHLGHSIYKE